MWVYLNDTFVKQEDARISVFDHGFLYGDGVYETLRAYEGQLFLLDRHLVRLKRSCSLIGLHLPIPFGQWPPLLSEILQRNQLANAVIRITISRGEGEMGLDPSLCRRPTVVVVARPFKPYPATWLERGITLALVDVRRNPLSAQSPRIKSLSFLNNILAKQAAIRAGALDALMLNIDGYLTECTTSNIFFIHAGIINTPSVDCGILDGVTREFVMWIAREEGISVQEGLYTSKELLEAEECFITNTSMEVMPVGHVGKVSIGSICPGPLTKKIGRLFQEKRQS
jgi:branched-chain amino acid aminotransferase